MVPKSKECTCTERMNRGNVISWNLSWTKERIRSARASPSGPEVAAAQSTSIDMAGLVQLLPML